MMAETFTEMLAVGGKSNSLGRVSEVIELVLKDKSQLDELYNCLFESDEWVRMRAGDALEKVCREHPDWLQPYVDRLLSEVASVQQASVQWHLAQMLGEISLTPTEIKRAAALLKSYLKNKDADWIVTSNSMETLAKFVREGNVESNEVTPLLRLQQDHHSKTVAKRAARLLKELGHD